MGIRVAIAMILTIILVLIFYRYYFMSMIFNGVWIASDDFKNESGVQEIVLVVSGGTYKKKATLTVSNGADTVTDIGEFTLIPDATLWSPKAKLGCTTTLKGMEGACKIILGIDNSLVIEGNDKTFFEGIKI